MNAEERQRFALFLFAGGTAALVNILSRIAFNWLMPYEVAIVVAYLCGMTTAYLLNKHFVFPRVRRWRRAVHALRAGRTSLRSRRFGSSASVSRGWLFPRLASYGTPKRSRT